jgi:hypothetical protein
MRWINPYLYWRIIVLAVFTPVGVLLVRGLDEVGAAIFLLSVYISNYSGSFVILRRKMSSTFSRLGDKNERLD